MELGMRYHGVQSRNAWGTRCFSDGEYETQKHFNFVQMQQLNKKQTALAGENDKLWGKKKSFIYNIDLYAWHFYSHKFYKNFYSVLAMFCLILKLLEGTDSAQLHWNLKRKSCWCNSNPTTLQRPKGNGTGPNACVHLSSARINIFIEKYTVTDCSCRAAEVQLMLCLLCPCYSQHQEKL